METANYWEEEKRKRLLLEGMLGKAEQVDDLKEAYDDFIQVAEIIGGLPDYTLTLRGSGVIVQNLPLEFMLLENPKEVARIVQTELSIPSIDAAVAHDSTEANLQNRVTEAQIDLADYKIQLQKSAEILLSTETKYPLIRSTIEKLISREDFKLTQWVDRNAILDYLHTALLAAADYLLDNTRTANFRDAPIEKIAKITLKYGLTAGLYGDIAKRQLAYEIARANKSPDIKQDTEYIKSDNKNNYEVGKVPEIFTAPKSLPVEASSNAETQNIKTDAPLRVLSEKGSQLSSALVPAYLPPKLPEIPTISYDKIEEALGQANKEISLLNTSLDKIDEGIKSLENLVNDFPKPEMQPYVSPTNITQPVPASKPSISATSSPFLSSDYVIPDSMFTSPYWDLPDFDRTITDRIKDCFSHVFDNVSYKNMIRAAGLGLSVGVGVASGGLAAGIASAAIGYAVQVYASKQMPYSEDIAGAGLAGVGLAYNAAGMLTNMAAGNYIGAIVNGIGALVNGIAAIAQVRSVESDYGRDYMSGMRKT